MDSRRYTKKKETDHTLYFIRQLMISAKECNVQSVTVGDIKIVLNKAEIVTKLPKELETTMPDPLNDDLLFYSSE